MKIFETAKKDNKNPLVAKCENCTTCTKSVSEDETEDEKLAVDVATPEVPVVSDAPIATTDVADPSANEPLETPDEVAPMDELPPEETPVDASNPSEQLNTILQQMPEFAEFIASLAAKLAGTSALSPSVPPTDEPMGDEPMGDLPTDDEVFDAIEVEDDEEIHEAEEVEDDEEEAEEVDGDIDVKADDADALKSDDENAENADDVDLAKSDVDDANMGDDLEADDMDDNGEESKDAAEALAELTMQDWLDVLAKIN